MTDNRQEAYAQLESRVADMAKYLELANEDVDVHDDEIYEHEDGELSPVSEYGLEWRKASTDHVNETVTYHHVLSTGGPHEQFNVTFEGSKVVDVWFVSLPWFGREEIGLVGNDRETAKDFYETFYGDLVEAEG